MTTIRQLYRFAGSFLIAAVLTSTVTARTFDLEIGETTITINGEKRSALTINGGVPGPVLRFKEGEQVTLNVTNTLSVDTSIHWHGLILPYQQDGVPGVSFDGIKPGTTFTYTFPIIQTGAYWYHSHSGMQEQQGVYGQIVIEPKDQPEIQVDRDYSITLSDFSSESPYQILRNLKRNPDYYNRGKRTLFDLFKDAERDGWDKTLEERRMWGDMRMLPSDIADVSAATYDYLVNGHGTKDNWTALFKPGEKIRLRFANAAAMTYFDVRIPGLKMTVIEADGNRVKPLVVDEFRISVAETFDVIVEPEEDKAYTIFAESLDRSGYARGTLAPRQGMEAAVPELRPRPQLTMFDMRGHHADHSGHGGHGNHGAHAGHQMAADDKVDHSKMDHSAMDHSKMDHSKMGHTATPAYPESSSIGVDPRSGLAHYAANGGTVMTYGDLVAEKPLYAPRPPDRVIEMRVTGNMERYMWSFDDIAYANSEPIRLILGERVRFKFTNETMMSHPLHLHGMWMLLDTGRGANNPIKHVINIAPGDTITFDVEVDAPGKWVFHCHLMYHMMAGMFREVVVIDPTKQSALSPALQQ